MNEDRPVKHKADHPKYYAEHQRGGISFYNRVCVIPSRSSMPGHPCIDDNRIFDFDGFFRIRDIITFINETGLQAQTIPFEDIWYAIRFPGQMEEVKSGPRYAQADTSFPGIVSPVKNPLNKPYRLLDGRRRMWKLQDMGETEGSFYVIPKSEVYQFFWMTISRDGR